MDEFAYFSSLFHAIRSYGDGAKEGEESEKEKLYLDASERLKQLRYKGNDIHFIIDHLYWRLGVKDGHEHVRAQLFIKELNRILDVMIGDEEVL
jgi:hypothetical protein